MPQFDLTDQELSDLSDFLDWTEQDQHPGLAAERRGLRRKTR